MDGSPLTTYHSVLGMGAYDKREKLTWYRALEDRQVKRMEPLCDSASDCVRRALRWRNWLVFAVSVACASISIRGSRRLLQHHNTTLTYTLTRPSKPCDAPTFNQLREAMSFFRNTYRQMKEASKRCIRGDDRRQYDKLEGPNFEELSPDQCLKWNLYELGLLPWEGLPSELQAGYPWNETYTAREEMEKQQERKK
ncbi:hypothetical protein K491DRAFT_269167 [Lophiostoma macrostomum CBS 122681]|uniref:Uncharacterized protein n=1 Tax=Lophiostoma macrostomum CBS 122681 TaxID=1314788 RepID=A0A6A6TGH1_9PLEO|nr:hypothetical protein K491DRAFT_269167 [Lophiostoma macrostomum CBS 122681]